MTELSFDPKLRTQEGAVEKSRKAQARFNPGLYN